MTAKLTIFGILTLFMLTIAAPAMAYADEQTPQNVHTAIDQILAYKSGLQLTDSQVHKLEIVNKVILQKMGELMHQADIRKSEIDDYTSNWSTMHGTAVDYMIKEYYQFMADLKNLELEAIMKARAILNEDQLKKFHDLASIQSLVVRVENELASSY